VKDDHNPRVGIDRFPTFLPPIINIQGLARVCQTTLDNLISRVSPESYNFAQKNKGLDHVGYPLRGV